MKICMKNKKRKQNQLSENYLEKIPERNKILVWNADENGMVTVDIENKGAVNTIAQKLFKKPRVSHIHLEEKGSFIWQAINGKDDITEIGKKVKEHFGDEAEPLYERLAEYIGILESNNFIKLK